MSQGVIDRVLERLKLSRGVTPDLDGLRTVYAAWCASMPFDNTAKLIALGTNAPGNLPGIDAEEFFERWLTHDVGGTCWPSSNALFVLLDSLGFRARRAAGSMRDTGIMSHGTVKVRIADKDWLVDSSMLTNVVIPLTDRVFVGGDPVFPVEVEIHDGAHVIWWDLPPNPTWIPCRLLADDVSHKYYVERYEASRERSPFNERIYARRNLGNAILIVTGNRRIRKDQSGIDSTELDDAALYRSLRNEIGVSELLLDQLTEMPAWKMSFIPPPPAAVPANLREKPKFLQTSPEAER
jgi:arylamine N-acetyltransferase